jgi:hypothetical protein
LFAVLEGLDFCFIALIVMLFTGSAGAYAYIRPADAARLRRLEWKLDLLLKHFNIEAHNLGTAAALSEAVRSLADNPATKIQAIQLHREQTGAGLREAKDAVEAYIERRH